MTARAIVALDVPNAAEADSLLESLGPTADFVKVGSELFTAEGPRFVRHLRAERRDVFLDLKWHDIPNTVAGAVAAARDAGVAMATVHTLGGVEMMRAARAAAGDELELVGVTVLTSHDDASFARVVGRRGVKAGAEVLRLAETAATAGLAGIVCSPREARVVRERLGPAARLVVPGIRRSADAPDDQRRTASAAEAVRDGATHLVVGRPITTAAEPADVLAELMREGGCDAG